MMKLMGGIAIEVEVVVDVEVAGIGMGFRCDNGSRRYSTVRGDCV